MPKTAQCRFEGTVRGLQHWNGLVRVLVSLGNGIEISSELPQDYVDAQGIQVGDEVIAVLVGDHIFVHKPEVRQDMATRPSAASPGANRLEQQCRRPGNRIME